MRLIDADYLRNKLISNCPIEEGGVPLKDFASHQKILELYPTIDAVPVVRCGGCKLSQPSSVCSYRHCRLFGKTVAEWDFCSYGERKDGAEGGEGRR